MGGTDAVTAGLLLLLVIIIFVMYVCTYVLCTSFQLEFPRWNKRQQQLRERERYEFFRPKRCFLFLLPHV